MTIPSGYFLNIFIFIVDDFRRLMLATITLIELDLTALLGQLWRPILYHVIFAVNSQ